MSLDRAERQRLLVERATAERAGGQAIRWGLVKAVGISNSADIIEGGLICKSAGPQPSIVHGPMPHDVA